MLLGIILLLLILTPVLMHGFEFFKAIFLVIFMPALPVLAFIALVAYRISLG